MTVSGTTPAIRLIGLKSAGETNFGRGNRYPNLVNEASSIENDFCTSKHDQNSIDQDSIKIEIRNGWEGSERRSSVIDLARTY